MRCCRDRGTAPRSWTSPDSENSLFSAPMKIRTPSPVSARWSRSMTSVLVSRSSKSRRMRSRSSSAVRSSSRLRLAAHDQPPLGRPAGPPSSRGPHRPAASVSSSSSPWRGHSLGLDLGAGLGQRPARGCGHSGSCRPRPAPRPAGPPASTTTRFSTEPSSATRTASARSGVEPHEFDVLQPGIVLASSPPRRRRASGPTAGSWPRPARLRACGSCEAAATSASMRRRSPSPAVADLEQGVDEKPQAQLGRQPARAGVGREDQAPALRDPA